MREHFKPTTYTPNKFPLIAGKVSANDPISIFEVGIVSFYGRKAYQFGGYSPDYELTYSVARLLGLDYDTEDKHAIFLGNAEELAEALKHAVGSELLVDTEPLGSCAVCGKPFTLADYDERHSDTDDMDSFYHPECCPICNAESELYERNSD